MASFKNHIEKWKINLLGSWGHMGNNHYQTDNINIKDQTFQFLGGTIENTFITLRRD